MQKLLHILRALPLLVLSPFLAAAALLCLVFTDLFWRLAGTRRSPSGPPRDARAASIVIPNWNGRDLLEKYLPSVVAAAGTDHEIIVVDNGSGDGSVVWLREAFPQVRVLALPANLGFGSGSNAGFRAARHDIVVLLNSDMRVEPDFLPPLLEGFQDPAVFSVACQIFLSDPARRREETGLTQGWWQNGLLRVRHRIDGAIASRYPCFYGGGGSCAFDRRRFLELGGFDPLLAPFYLEDTDIGYLAWKRGWKVLYEPRSRVYHEHRGTIGRRFTDRQIQAVLKKNYLLFCWKNIHEGSRLAAHFLFLLGDVVVSALFGDSPERSNVDALWKGFLQLPRAIGSRWRARSLATISDTEAFRRPLGGYFRDRFEPMPDLAEGPLRVLFVSPYPICPPTHGGGVFMNYTVRELARHSEVHLIALLDRAGQREAHRDLERCCASAEFIVRLQGQPRQLGSIVPHAIREFASADLEWLIHRQIYTRGIDMVQLEYTALGQYACSFERIACALFEHDVYFQSVGRALQEPGPIAGKLKAGIEYLRALRYELRLLPRLDHIQTCSQDNQEYLLSFLPTLRGRVQHGLRAGIETGAYAFQTAAREPDTMLFLGSFRHKPNHAALEWFARRVLPRVLERRPQARLVVVGSDPPPRYSLPASPAIELRGFVDDIRESLERYAVFVCPILSGSGVRVKLLEAFAAGIPVVSTRLGAEGLAHKDGEFCALADDPAAFTDRIVALFESPGHARAMAERARREVVQNWDTAVITSRLVESYREVLRRKERARPDAKERSGALTTSSA